MYRWIIYLLVANLLALLLYLAEMKEYSIFFLAFILITMGIIGWMKWTRYFSVSKPRSNLLAEHIFFVMALASLFYLLYDRFL